MSVGAWTVAFLGSTAFLVAVVAAVWWLDRYDREPVHLVAGVFVWGALAAPVASVLMEVLIHAVAAGSEAVRHLQVVVAAPLIEEAAKGVAILLVMVISDQFDNPTDGIVYGTAAGLGFAVAENALAMAAAAGGGTLWPVAAVRTLASSGVHALATATVGGFLGVAYLSRRAASRIGWGLLGWGAGAALHGLWNGAVLQVERAGSGAPLAAALGALAVAYLGYAGVLAGFLGWERRILRRELAEEVRLGVLPAWVAEVIPSYRRRVRGDWWPVRRERTVIARLLTRLAFRKHAVAHLPREEAGLAGLEVVRLRERARRILDAADHAPPSGQARVAG